MTTTNTRTLKSTDGDCEAISTQLGARDPCFAAGCQLSAIEPERARLVTVHHQPWDTSWVRAAQDQRRRGATLAWKYYGET